MPIKNIIVTKADLRNIYAFLARKADADAKEVEENDSNRRRSEPDRPTITVVSGNSMKTEVDDETVFDNDVLDLQKTDSVNFAYSNYRPAKSISIMLKEADGETSYGNSLSVGGEDPSWVDATFVELERIFAAVRPQSHLLKKFRWIAVIVLAFAIGHSWNELTSHALASLIPLRIDYPAPGWVVYLREHATIGNLVFRAINSVMDIATGFFPSLMLVEWLQRLWPTVEFDFGPEHLKRRKRLRGRLAVVFTLLLLPLFIEIFKRYALGWH